MVTTTLRGHEIKCINNGWVYADTGESTEIERNCKHCGKPPTKKGHDACLGELPGGITNACCGHGKIHEAYITFSDGLYINGQDAITLMDILKRWRDKE